jgi:hypothetical protein
MKRVHNMHLGVVLVNIQQKEYYRLVRFANEYARNKSYEVKERNKNKLKTRLKKYTLGINFSTKKGKFHV